MKAKRSVTHSTIPAADLPRRILMTRSLADCGPVAAQLLPLGETITYLQPFETQPTPMSDDDATLLLAAADDTAATLVFNSPRAVDALQATDPHLLAAWRLRLVFAVGPGTAAALQSAGFSHVDAAAGDSASLMARLALLARDHGLRRVYQLAGDVNAVDLAAAMKGTDITVARLTVYHAALQPVPQDIADGIMSGDVTDVVLLSARVALHLAPLMKQAPILPRLYCLSERIAQAARQALAPDVPLAQVAPQPLLTSLVPLLVAPPQTFAVLPAHHAD